MVLRAKSESNQCFFQSFKKREKSSAFARASGIFNVKVQTFLKKLAKLADETIDGLDDIDDFTDEARSELWNLLTGLQNHLGDTQEIFDKEKRKLDIWRG